MKYYFMDEEIQMLITGLGGAIGSFLGGWDGFLYALVVMVVIDYLTGLLNALVNRELSSKIGFTGIAKKITIFFMVAVASVLDKEIITRGETVRTAVIFFYLSNEGISILENISGIGGDNPPVLISLFRNMLEEAQKKKEYQENEDQEGDEEK